MNSFAAQVLSTLNEGNLSNAEAARGFRDDYDATVEADDYGQVERVTFPSGITVVFDSYHGEWLPA